MEQQKEYYTFISYIQEDKKEANQLQHVWEYYCLPNHLRQENPKLSGYVRPVFRDMTGQAIRQQIVCVSRNEINMWIL